MSLPRAFIRCLESDIAGAERWVLASSVDQLLDAPIDDIIYVDSLKSQDTLDAFELRHPASAPGLTRIAVAHHKSPSSVYVHDKEWSDLRDLPAVCELAKQRGKVLITSTMPAPTRSYDYKKRRYVHGPSPLLQYGCYLHNVAQRYIDGIPHIRAEVVYNPKVAKQREVARRAINADEPKALGKKRLTIAHLNSVTNSWYEWLPRYGLLMSICGNTRDRWRSVENFRCVLTQVWLVYGKDAHRQSSAFQQLLDVWREPGVAAHTRESWPQQKIESAASAFTRLFAWLDEEAAMPKPRKRKLETRAPNKPVSVLYTEKP